MSLLHTIVLEPNKNLDHTGVYIQTICKPFADGVIPGSDRAINIPVGLNAMETQEMASQLQKFVSGRRKFTKIDGKTI